MGYYVKGKGSLIIPSPFKAEFSLKVRMMLNNTAAMRGGSWSSEGKTEHWYSWVNSEKLIDACSKQDVMSIFACWGFYCTSSDNDEYKISYDSKSGQEDLFLKEIASFIKRGEIIWSGEDGSVWKNQFKDGQLRTLRLTPNRI